VRYGSVMLESALKIGRWRYLEDEEIDELLVTLGLKSDKRKQQERHHARRGTKASSGKAVSEGEGKKARPAAGRPASRPKGSGQEKPYTAKRGGSKAQTRSHDKDKDYDKTKRSDKAKSSDKTDSRGKAKPHAKASAPSPWANSQPGGKRRR